MKRRGREERRGSWGGKEIREKDKVTGRGGRVEKCEKIACVETFSIQMFQGFFGTLKISVKISRESNGCFPLSLSLSPSSSFSLPADSAVPG